MELKMYEKVSAIGFIYWCTFGYVLNYTMLTGERGGVKVIYVEVFYYKILDWEPS